MEIPGYKIQHEVGKGGMATVYLATQESLNRSVVLKILDVSGPASSGTLVERFLSEGRIVAALNHPNIITIFDIGIADEHLFISMEYIKGGDLKTRMELPVTPDTALDYLAKIGSGLAEAHKRGVVHRDIKPANVMFRDENTPLITDFGIAKQTDAADNDLTSTGLFLGSPNYVSPEQADGIEIDGRADIYSTGCMFYEMLTGMKPYQATTVFDVIIKHKQAPIPVLEEEFAEFQPLLNKMMAKNRDQRFADADAMVISIKELQQRRAASSADMTFDIIGANKAGEAGGKNTPLLNILLLLLMTSGGIFGTLQYAASRMNDASPKIDNVPTSINLPDEIQPLEIPQAAEAMGSTEIEPPVKISDDIVQALHWLGKKSLEEYRLTHPPEDNAYYYFSRLLQANATDKVAAAGLLNIADRYAYLAERSILDNDFDKAEAYISIGQKFNPQHEDLIKLSKLNLSVREKSFVQKLKDLFSNSQFF
jgi:serine/threonine protein kinase